MEIVFDIETDGLLDSLTKIHCLSYYNLETEELKSLVSYSEMKKLLLTENLTLIGHNILRFDIVALEKILKIKIKAKKIDTLPISWYLETKRKKHGLEEWGEFFGVPKPVIKDWKNLSIEQYTVRCEEDVKINTKLWDRQIRYLRNLYDEDTASIQRLLNYFEFKMDCVREQEEEGLKLDEERCKRVLAALEKEREVKLSELKKVMPKVPIYKKKKFINSVIDKTGNIAMRGELFYTPIAIPEEKEVKVLKGHKDPNPRSPVQIKKWLYDLGWVPEHIKFVRNKATGDIKEIPQIGHKDGGGEVCQSLKKLFKKEPKLEVLNGLSIINHRVSLFEGFLKEQKEGKLYPSMNGLTNTMRLQHKVVVNLPGVGKKYGEDVRGCLIADEGYILCGSDLSNIEDRTKRHYIYSYDPGYVEEMSIPGYDAHLNIGVLAGMITQEESDFYKRMEEKISNKEELTNEEKKEYKKVKGLRARGKTANFSATYKVGASTLSRNSGLPLKEAKRLLEVYWQRNDAILKVEDSLHVKEIGTQKWLLNPVSNLWYSLRAEKDRFSTLNQSTAVFVFDIWVTLLRKYGLKIALQMHDEIVLNVKKGMETKTAEIIQKAMNKVNEKLKLNVKVGCSTAWGPNYAEIH